MYRGLLVSRRAVLIFLVAVGVGIIFDTISFLLRGPPEKNPISDIQNSDDLVYKMKNDVAPIVAETSEIFGSVQRTSDPEVNGEVIPETALEIRLLGVFSDRFNKKSAAIIERKDEESTLVMIGDVLPDGVKVSRILKDRVIFNKNGEKEQLPLTKWKDYKNVKDKIYKDKNKKNKDLKKDDKVHPPTYSEFLAHAGLKRVNAEMASGYMVGEGAEAVKEQYGLQQGDIILSVNGYPVGAEADDRLAGSSLIDGAGKMKVLRGGRTLTVNVPALE